MEYIHTHSEFSNIKGYDALNKIKAIPQLVYDKGSTAAFITDHDHLGGAVRFLEAVEEVRKKDLNFKGVIGNEIYLTRDGLNKDTWERGEKLSHLILLAKNRKGWEVLNELSSHAWGNSFTSSLLRTPTYKSFFEKTMLEKGKGNIIITTACLGGPLGHKILEFHKTRDEALKQEIFAMIQWFKSLTAEGDFYLEVQPALYPEQKNYNAWLVAFAKATNTPLVVATDAHYEKKEDFDTHNSFLNSQEKYSKYRETAAFYQYTYFMDEEEVKANLLQCPNFTQTEVEEAIGNTTAIAEKCEHYSIKSPNYLMETKERTPGWEQWLEQNIERYSAVCQKFYAQPQEINRYFLYDVLTNLEDKIKRGWVDDQQRTYDRVDEELSTIMEVSATIQESLGKYFQTMREMMSIIWEISLVGPGRGSAGASLVCFLLDITSVNPLTVLPDQELPFWRFSHPSRPEMADIDWDSSSSLKEEIIRRLNAWAQDNNHILAKVATYGTLKSKKALQVSAKGLGYETEDILWFSSLVPVERGFPKSLTKCLEEEKMFQEAYKSHKEVIDNAIKLEGLIVAMGSHAAAITFFKDGDKYSRCAFVKTPKDEVFSTCFDLEDLDKIQAAIKFDMLQTSAIDSVQTTMMLLVEDGLIEWQGSLKATYDKYFHPSVIDETNPKLWEKIRKQDIIGLFQLTAS